MFAGVVSADAGVLEKLRQIPEISDIKEKKVNGFGEYYEFWFEQPVDHSDISKGTFRQKVFLGHKRADAPVIAELQGYEIGSGAEGELSSLFKANQLTVEHRFFDQSVPKGKIPWEYLTIKQAATDHHNIIQAIKKTVYPSSVWISTGISKGGQTTIFHRYFYPGDVDISVPYVAPLNLAYVDPRLEKFLDKLGVAKANGIHELFAGDDLNSPHWAVRDFQLLCFKNQDTLAGMLQEMAGKAGYTYEIVGGVKRALQLMVLEYPFAFWQWGNNAADIPEEESADMVEIFNYLMTVSTPEFFEDKYIVRMQPFFYAALTETGMYDYNIKPFKKYFSEDKKNIDFSFAMPGNAKKKPFDAEQMRAINKWLQTDAEKMLFVYGGSDPWYATGVDLKTNWKSRKYVKGDASHTCRIRDFDPVSKEDLIDTLKEWMKEVER
ncbi:MAG: peptidase [Odoribacter sp.]|nr:peptidase [Odoribacter sp.]